MNISDIWMRLESMAHLRDLGPKYKALHDRLAKEIEAASAEFEPKPEVVRGPPPIAATPAMNPRPLSDAEAKALAEQREARSEAARKSLEATAGRPSLLNQPPTPTIGAQDMTDAERALQRPAGDIRPPATPSPAGPVDPVTHEPIPAVDRRDF